MFINEILQLPNFFEVIRTPKLSFKTAYKLAKLSKAVEEELSFYKEKMQEIIYEYGEKDSEGNLVLIEDGTGVVLNSNTQEECYQKIAELEYLEVELPNIKFSVEEFAGTTLSLEELQPILPFIED